MGNVRLLSTDIHEREWLAVKEVAAELGVSPTLVYRAVHEGPGRSFG
jgi:hypothetical protein